MTCITGVVSTAQVRGPSLVALTTLFEVSCPVHALTIGEGCEVSVLVHTHLHVVAPHAGGGGAVGAGVSQRARHWTCVLVLLLHSCVLRLSLPSSQTLLLSALLLLVPHALVHGVAAVAGVQVGADLLGLGIQTLA